MRVKLEAVGGRKMIPLENAVLELVGLGGVAEVDLSTDTGKRLVIQAVQLEEGSAEALKPLSLENLGDPSELNPERPADSARAIKALIPLGLDLRRFRLLHHAGARASLTTHAAYCEWTKRFNSATNITVARRLFKILELRQAGLPIDEAVAKAVAEYEFPNR